MTAFEKVRTAFYVAILLLAVFYFSLHVTVTTVPPDRKDVTVITDTKTGCQYIAAQGAGVVPRMEQDGKQVCGEAS